MFYNINTLLHVAEKNILLFITMERPKLLKVYTANNFLLVFWKAFTKLKSTQSTGPETQPSVSLWLKSSIFNSKSSLLLIMTACSPPKFGYSSSCFNLLQQNSVELSRDSDASNYIIESFFRHLKALWFLTLPYLQTGCRPAWYHTARLPAAHKEWAPDTVTNT